MSNTPVRGGAGDQRVLAVDWEAVEDAVGHPVDEEARTIVETRGGTTALNTEGREDIASVALFTSVNENAELIHPEIGPLDARYVPCDNVGLSHLTGAIRVGAYGHELNVGTLVEAVDGDEADISFADGLADLYEAAVGLDERHADVAWYDDGHPRLGHGSYGPDMLGNVYITAKHRDREVLDELDVSGLPVEREGISAVSPSFRQDFDEHHRVIFRHERYYTHPWSSKPYGGRTYRYLEAVRDNVGLVDYTAGSTASTSPLPAILEDECIEYEELGELSAEFTPRQLDVYRYDRHGETRYAVVWYARAGIDDVVVRNVVFDQRPSADDVSAVQALTDVERAFRRGDVSPAFQCWECGQESHWLDITDSEGRKLSLEQRLEQAKRSYCGC